MGKIRGKDFDNTVIIAPEENGALEQESGDSNKVAPPPLITEAIKGPPRGLSRWSVFFLVVLVLLLGIGFFLYSPH